MSKKRIALLVILELGGLVSLLLGLSWGALLHAYAAYLAEAENVFNLVNPDHASLAQAVVAGIVNLGHFHLVFGIAAMLVGLLGAVYARLQLSGNPRWKKSQFRQAFLVVAAILVLLTVGIAARITNALSYEDKLAADPPEAGLAFSASKGLHTDCTMPPTPQQQGAADKLVKETKAGVAKYTDLSAATAAGYQPMSPTWQPVTHYLNPAYQRDGEILDPERPEALVYANTSKGPILVGAMYLMPHPGVSGPQIGGCLTQWHAHSLLKWETPEMMHVWVVDVPAGPFDELKPRQFVQSLENSS
jgi:hypothetical protein